MLSHYDAIVWESGDDIITRAPGQAGGTADKLSLDLELSVRDYLNEGGKALVTGQYNQFAQAANGVYDYNPFAPPQCTTPDTYPCLPLFNDFHAVLARRLQLRERRRHRRRGTLPRQRCGG